MSRIIKRMLGAGCLVLLLSGCGGESRSIYKDASENLEMGYYEEAAGGYRQVIDAGELLPEAYRGAGIAYLKQGDYVKASESFQKALEQDGVGKNLRRDILLYQATAQYKGKMFDAAGKAMEEALAIREDAEALYLNGKVQLGRDAYDEAARSFSKAYDKEKTYQMSIAVYQAYLERDMEADGTVYLEKSLEGKPKKAEDYCRRGEIYYYMQDYENAKKELTEAVNKGSREGSLLLGKVYFSQKDLENAKVMYREYVSEGEDTAEGYNGLALCAVEEQNYPEALDQIEKGLRAAQGDEAKDLLFNQAVVYEKKQEYPAALKKFQEYLRLFPDDETAKKELAFLKSRLGIKEKQEEA